MSNSTPRDFDQVAASWDEKPQRRILAEAVTSAISNSIQLHQELEVMEYGCGTGLVGLQLAKKVGHLTAVDTSAGMLEELQKKSQSMGLENVTPNLISSDRWTLPATAFDLVFSSMVLHHITETEPLLGHLLQTLKPGGFLALADLEQEDGTFHGDPTGVAHHGFDLKALKTMLEELGFTELTTQTIHTIQKQNGEYPIFLMTAQKPL